MKNWTIARRISLGFTIVILIAIGLGLFAHNRLRVIRQGAGAIAGHSVPGLLVINDIQSLARRNYSETLKYVAEEDHQARARIFAVIQTNINAINRLTNDYGRMIVAAEDRALFAGLLAARAEYVPAFKRVCQLCDEGKQQEAKDWLRAGVDPASDKFMAAIDAGVAFNRREVGNATSGINTSVGSAQSGIILGLIAATGAAVLISLVIISGVNRALRSAAETLCLGAEEVTAAAGQVAAASQSLAEGGQRAGGIPRGNQRRA